MPYEEKAKGRWHKLKNSAQGKYEKLYVFGFSIVVSYKGLKQDVCHFPLLKLLGWRRGKKSHEMESSKYFFKNSNLITYTIILGHLSLEWDNNYYNVKSCMFLFFSREN